MKPLALYIHWPFCKRKCPYCDFNSHVRDAIDQPAWRAALLQELRYWHRRVAGERYRLNSIFFGGGTPSLAPPDTIAALIAEAKTLWPHDEDDLEITMEANPTSVEAAAFAQLAGAGVNRISLGIQSFDDTQLAFLGREHSAKEAREALAIAQRYFDRYSFDLIYALPEQTPKQWERALREALPHANGHMSLYQLTIEPNTAFHHAYHVKRDFALPPDDDAAHMYARTNIIMAEAGMPAYEISNYAAAGHACRHNLAYWRYRPYLGIGPGAHGRVDIRKTRYATATIASPERWLHAVQAQNHGLQTEEALDANAQHEERVMMGLRLLQEGIEAAPLPRHKTDPLIAQALLEMCGTQIRPTSRGALLLNYVIGELLT
jgi:putative oxygen-independent coproporphyrinogen III oxidase